MEKNIWFTSSQLEDEEEDGDNKGEGYSAMFVYLSVRLWQLENIRKDFS